MDFQGKTIINVVPSKEGISISQCMLDNLSPTKGLCNIIFTPFIKICFLVDFEVLFSFKFYY